MSQLSVPQPSWKEQESLCAEDIILSPRLLHASKGKSNLIAFSLKEFNETFKSRAV